MLPIAPKSFPAAVAIGLAAIAMLGGCGFHHFHDAKFEESRDIDRVIPPDAAQNLRIHFQVGEVALTNSDDGQIHVTGRLTVKGDDEEQVERLAAELDLDVAAGETLVLSLPEPESGVNYGVDLEIAVPKGLDLDLESNVGSLRATLDPPNSLKVRLNVGEIALRLPEDTAATITARLNVGDVAVRGFETVAGETEREHFVGAEFKGSIGDPAQAAQTSIDAEMDVGEISIRPQ